MVEQDMTQLDIVIERLKALPPAEQEALAAEIEFMLEGEAPTLTQAAPRGFGFESPNASSN